jgi:predicted ThiF/HesA family dinucleotide-utilizing enzyme
MLKRHFPFLAVLLFAGSPVAAHDMSSSTTIVVAANSANPAMVAATKKAVENLWIGHINAVRNVVVAEIAGRDTKVAESEVVSNAHAIADAIAGFYGKPAGDKLFTLLAAHYGAVKAYLDATVARDSAKQSAATDKITANVDDIATFLSGANPYLPKATVAEMFTVHGSHHISQIQELAAKESAAEAKTQVEMKDHMIAIADALVDAIARQFPEKF